MVWNLPCRNVIPKPIKWFINSAEKYPLFFVIIGGKTNFYATYNQLVNSKSKTYCQKTTL